GLVIVKLNDVVPFNGIVAAPNDLLIDGGATTVTFAEAVLPVPPLVELTLPVVLFFSPTVVPLTVTTIVQSLAVAIVPPDKLMLPVPSAAVSVPPQLVVG